MPPPIRCFTTNEAIGQYYLVIDAIRKHLEKNTEDKTLSDYLAEFTLTSYPQRMRIIGYTRFQDAHLTTHNPIKDKN